MDNVIVSERVKVNGKKTQELELTIDSSELFRETPKRTKA